MAGSQSSSTGNGFFSTAPGVLTAVAAVITALGGVYGVYASQDHGASAEPSPVVTTVTSAPTSDPTDTPAPPPPDPVGSDVISGIAVLHDGTAQESSAGVDPFDTWYSGADVDSQLTAYSCELGDVDACATLEAILVADCQASWDAACDVLYLAEPVGSDLEDLGATCGYLYVDWTYAGECAT